MSRASCISALAAEGIELDKQQLDGVASYIEQVIRDANERGDNVFDAVQKSIDDFIDGLAEVANVVKRNAALNYEARSRMEGYVQEHWDDAPAEGMRTLLTGVQADRPGAKAAVAVVQNQLADKYIGGLVSRLEAVGKDGSSPMDYVKPKWWGGHNEHSADVMRIMYHMNQAEPDTAKYQGKPASMIKAARILLDAQETARKDANAAGAYQIAKLDNRIMRRTHDALKMAGAGEEAWKKDMALLFDREKSRIPEEDWDAALTAHYIQTVSGHRTANPDSNPETNSVSLGEGNISKAMAQERVFVAKGVDEEIAYFQKYSRGDLLETIVFDLEVSAQRTGLMRRFGPNAKANFKAVEQSIGYKLRNTSGGEKKYTRYSERMNYIMRTHWPMIDGSLFVPASNTIAKAGQWYRAVKMMALLGKAVITSIVDIPIYATQVKFSKGSFFGGMAEAIRSLATNRKPGSDRILAGLGVVADGMRNTTMSRFDPDHLTAGGAARMTELFFKLNLLTPWTDRLRTGYALSRSNDLANLSAKSFSNLPSEWQRSLRQFGIDDAEWNVIKKGALKEFDGRKYITPESIRDIDDAVIVKFLETKGLANNKLNIRKYRDELSDSFGSFYNYTANTAALTPDAGTRAAMLQGTQAGDTVGEVVRFVGMFKSFPTAYMRQVLGRDILGHRSDIPAGVIDKYTNNTAMMNMTRTIASTTLFGFMAMYISDFADGKETPEITEENFTEYFMKAMLKGGALGHYGDFLIGEASRTYGTNIVTGFLGPAAQDIQTVYDIYTKMRSTDPQVSSAGADALMMLFKNVPGSNLFYTKMVYDYLIIYNMMEMVDEGSLRRMEERREKRGDAQYYTPPSSGKMPIFN